MTLVINMRKKKGQPKSYFDIRIDRRSIFGNSHPIGQCNICNRIHDRRDCINEYKKDFYKKLENPEFRSKVLELRGKVLACWCKPLDCHGDVIVEWLDNPQWGIDKIYDGCMEM